MRRLLAALATAAFAAGVSAGDVYDAYGGFAGADVSRSDIRFEATEITSVQPGVGDVYREFNKDPDLFQWREINTAANVQGGQAPDIYGGFGGSSDLQF